MAYQTFVQVDGRIPADDIWLFLVHSVYQSTFISSILLHVTMQGMTNGINKSECQSSLILVIVIIDTGPSLQVAICRSLSEVYQEKASCNNLLVTLAMTCARMDLEVKANLAYTFRSIQGPQRYPWNPLPWTR